MPKFVTKPTRAVLTHTTAVSGTVEAFCDSCAEAVSRLTYWHCENGFIISQLKDHPRLSKEDAHQAGTLMVKELYAEAQKFGVTQLFFLEPDNTVRLINTFKPMVGADQLTTPTRTTYPIN